MTTNSTENKGMMSQVTDKMGGVINTLLELPDRPSSEIGRKVARIVADLLIISLGVTIFGMLTKFHPATLAAPSFSNLMVMSASIVVGGIGISWLLQDILAKKFHRTAGKIMALVMPVVMFAGAACLIAAGFQHGVTHVSVGVYWFTSLLILPCSFFAFGNAIDKLGQKKAHFVRRAAPRIYTISRK